MYTVTPEKLTDILLPLYLSGAEIPSIMIWGQPGVGKSDSVRKLAGKLQQQTGKHVHVEDVRLLMYNPVDLRGIPMPDAARETAIWLQPKIFKMDPNADKINILFLDELSAAPPSVQASAYQLILDRAIGEHKLPDNVIIIGAGNMVQDKGVAYKMPTPLANRMSHYLMVAEIDDWIEYATNKANPLIHEMIIGFLRFRPELLNCFNPKVEQSAFPTPRTWEFVSRYLHIYNDIEAAYPSIVSTIGQSAALEFKAFCNTYKELPQLDDILRGVTVKIDHPTPDVVYAISSLFVTHAAKFSADEMETVFHFLLDSNIDLELKVMCVRDLYNVKKAQQLLAPLPRFTELVTANPGMF
jgi:hypothetical protein